MSLRQVLDAFDRWRADAVPLVLVTVTETQGSTYSKAGHRILLTGAGDFRGLVSGGCLEGDLAEHGREVLATGQPRLLTYDLRHDTDQVWGLGIGCDGMFRLLLQPLLAAEDYAPFAAMAACLRGEHVAVTATVVESGDMRLPVGATLVKTALDCSSSSVAEPWRQRLSDGCGGHAAQAAAGLREELCDGHRARILYAPLRPLPRLLVLGAGLDAVPLTEMARSLGWRVTVADHRPAYLARGDLGGADATLHLVPGQLTNTIDTARYAAAIVMSHHLDTDRGWLESLAATAIPYIGLLGPAARGARLLAELGAAAELLRGRLHSPVGLDIGADSPETIALAVLAEVQASLHAARRSVGGTR